MARASDEADRARFAALVNMSPRDIAAWHKTDQSKSVGQDSGDGVSLGVKAGQRTIQLLRSKRWRYALMNWEHDPLTERDGDSPWR